MSPELTSIVSCANTDGTSYTQNCKEPPCGQLNPSSTLMYQVLGAVLQDVAMMFSSGGNKNMTLPFVHLGFDEVDSHCWTTSGDEEIFEVDKILDRRGNEEEGFEYLTVSRFFCVNLLTGVFSAGEGSPMTTIPGNRPRVSKAAIT